MKKEKKESDQEQKTVNKRKSRANSGNDEDEGDKDVKEEKKKGQDAVESRLAGEVMDEPDGADSQKLPEKTLEASEKQDTAKRKHTRVSYALLFVIKSDCSYSGKRKGI